MSCFDKIDYKRLKEHAKADGLTFVNAEEYGFVAVFSKPRSGLRMVEVAVSYCSPEDEFKKKHGRYQALLKYYSGESVQLPLGHWSEEDIFAHVAEMFAI